MSTNGSLDTTIPYGYHGYLTDTSDKFLGFYSTGTDVPVVGASSNRTLNIREPMHGVFLTGINILSISTSTSSSSSSSSTNTGTVSTTGNALQLFWSDQGSPSIVLYPGTITAASSASMMAPTNQIITHISISHTLPLISNPQISVSFDTGPSFTKANSFPSEQGFNGYIKLNSDGSFVGLAASGIADPSVAYNGDSVSFVPFKLNNDTNTPNLWLTGIQITRPALNSCSDTSCSVKLTAGDGTTTNNDRIFYVNVPTEVASINSNPPVTFQATAPLGKIINTVYLLRIDQLRDLMVQDVDYENAPGSSISSSTIGLYIVVAVIVLGVIFIIYAILRAQRRRRKERRRLLAII